MVCAVILFFMDYEIPTLSKEILGRTLSKEILGRTKTLNQPKYSVTVIEMDKNSDRLADLMRSLKYIFTK